MITAPTPEKSTDRAAVSCHLTSLDEEAIGRLPLACNCQYPNTLIINNLGINLCDIYGNLNTWVSLPGNVFWNTPSAVQLYITYMNGSWISTLVIWCNQFISSYIFWNMVTEASSNPWGNALRTQFRKRDAFFCKTWNPTPGLV